MSIVEIHTTLRRKAPSIPYERIARNILGKSHHLSLVVCGDSLARRMNRTYRQKHYAANVLSFALDRREGELFLNVSAAAREAKKLRVSIRARLILLFAHGCLHLKGLKHGRQMDKEERRILERFLKR